MSLHRIKIHECLMSMESLKSKIHPVNALYGKSKPFPIIPSCEHIAGSEILILKSLKLQEKLGPIFDITCDCEDGAKTGKETEHAEMVVKVLTSNANLYKMAGVRIHGFNHKHWKKDIDILIPALGESIAYLTIPKCTKAKQITKMVKYIKNIAKSNGIRRKIPIHVLIETHGALKEVWDIAKIDGVEVLDFGMMDFISEHHGAISASNLRSPEQFKHPLLVRAKTEIVAAALAHGVVASHNVTLDLKDPKQAYEDASQARNEFGFLRMWSIYPTQIEAIVDAMKPDYSEVQDAANILIAAQDNQWGPIQYHGELHDRATYRYFWQLLQRAQLSGVDYPEEAKNRFF